MEKNKNIIFTLPEGIMVVEVIDDILKSNNLEESKKEYLEKKLKKQTPRIITIRDAIHGLVQKSVSEERVIESLQRELPASKEVAEKIIKDIKEKLLPFAKIVNPKYMSGPEISDQELLLQKIKMNRPKEKDSFIVKESVKKPEIENVEENAEATEPTKKFTEEAKKITQEVQEKKLPENKFSTRKRDPDQYREVVE